MGNKSADPVVIRDCLAIKEEVEKIREEVATNRELYNTFLMAKTTAEISEAAHGMA